MANARICTAIHTHPQTDITADFATDFQYPARNVLSLPVNATWRTAQGQVSGQYIQGDLGDVQLCNFIAILGHNFSETDALTLRLRLANDPSFLSPTFDGTFGMEQNVGIVEGTSFPSVWIVWGLTGVKSRYWGIDIDQPGNGAGYIEIGRIILGEYWEPKVNFDYGYRMSVTDASQISRTTNNVMRVIPKPKTRQIQATVSHMDALEEVELNELSVGHEVFWSAYPESTDPYDRLEQQHTVDGMLASQVPVARNNAIDRAVTLQLMEGSTVGAPSGGSSTTKNNTLWLRVRNNLSDVADSTESCTNLGLFERFSRQNMFDNSSFAVWQRGNTFTGETASFNAADRWRIRHIQAGSETSSALRVENVDSGDPWIGAASTIRFSCTGPSDEFGIQQQFVGETVVHLTDVTLTLSFWFYGGAQGVTLDFIKYGINLVDTGYVDYDFNPSSLSAPAGTWTRYEGTVTLPNIPGTPINPRARVRISAMNPGTLTDLEFAIPKLEVGINSTRWEPENVADEFNRCLFHYCVGEQDSGQEAFFSGDINNNRDYTTQCSFPTTMYRIPDMTFTHVDSSNFPATPGTTVVGDGGFYETRTANGSGTGSYWRTAWIAATQF